MRDFHSVRCAHSRIFTQTLPCLADCGADFSHYEARRFLPQATLELLYRIQAEKELELADLEGLEKCP